MFRQSIPVSLLNDTKSAVPMLTKPAVRQGSVNRGSSIQYPYNHHNDLGGPVVELPLSQGTDVDMPIEWGGKTIC
jgi:hypothetical protein